MGTLNDLVIICGAGGVNILQKIGNVKFELLKKTMKCFMQWIQIKLQ